MKDQLKKLDGPSRRDFMVGAAGAAFGVSVLPSLMEQQLFAATGGKAKRCIWLYMSGGMTHLDTFDLKPGASTQGPTEAQKTNGAPINKLFGDFGKYMKHVVPINSLTTTTGDHGGANYLMHTAYPQRGTIKHPGMGCWLLYLTGWEMGQKNMLPGNVLIGGGSGQATSGWMDIKYAPLPIGNPAGGLPNSKPRVSKEQFDDRLQLASDLDAEFRVKYKNKKDVHAYTGLYQDAIRLMNSKELEVFDIFKEKEEVQMQYGKNGFGQGLLLARRLLENDVKFVEVDLGGWDNHAGVFDSMETRLPAMGASLAGLFKDLEEKNMIDDTLVVLTTEFGRTPRINGGQGRDHHPAAFSGFVAGGGVRGGQAYGKSDSQGYRVAENPVLPADFNATVAYALGLPQKVVKAPNGRPFQVGFHGKPITEIF
ncbi:MAG: DUF1501 domain-containing protein [Phycisphaera sp.]|nr:DUF1501 domain-containing protein [Phycisphaera sp.]